MNFVYEILRRSFTKGLIGGSRPWLILGIAVWILRALYWVLRPAPTVMYRHRIAVGESFIIRHEPAPPTRRERRRSRKKDRRAARKDRRRSDRA